MLSQVSVPQRDRLRSEMADIYRWLYGNPAKSKPKKGRQAKAAGASKTKGRMRGARPLPTAGGSRPKKNPK